MLPATISNAASMTAAPVSIVLMRISCPGQSTKETCLISSMVSSQPELSHLAMSALSPDQIINKDMILN